MSDGRARPGRYRHRIALEALPDTTDDHGTPIGPWTAYDSDVPASVEPLRGGEFHAAGASRSKVTHRIRLRDRSDVRASHRVTHDGDVYEIEAVVPPRVRGRELQIMAALYDPTRPDGHR